MLGRRPVVCGSRGRGYSTKSTEFRQIFANVGHFLLTKGDFFDTVFGSDVVFLITRELT